MKFNVLIFVIILSCSKQKINLNELSGYWEIDFIKKNNEKYIPKPSILQYDHYTINNYKGIMNKVELKIDGTYATSKDNSSFILEKINDYYFIKFRTKWDEWERKIKYLDNKKMILENNNFEYHYKRHFN
tara:strand:- start:300 stop:689 length:390 start_codon:yes stop_codon:yes gene_type:complete